jgi:hypothetical protein
MISPWGSSVASRTAHANVPEESHDGIVPMNHSNKDERPLAENEEGRPSIKENAGQPRTYPTQSGDRVSQGLAGVRKAAREHKEMRFTALLHHLTIDLLRESFYSLKRKAAPGVDGVTWQEYETGLEERLPYTLSPLPLDSFPHVAGDWPVILCQPVVHQSLSTRVQKRDQVFRLLRCPTTGQNYAVDVEDFVVGSRRVFCCHGARALHSRLPRTVHTWVCLGRLDELLLRKPKSKVSSVSVGMHFWRRIIESEGWLQDSESSGGALHRTLIS